MNYEIKREEWNDFFNALSKRRFEWRTEIEVLSPTLGDQMLNTLLPFNGITLERIGDRSTLEIAVGGETGHHQSHTVMDPARVTFLTTAEGGNEVLAIEEADGTKTLISFVEPIGLLVGFTQVEMAAAATMV